MEERSMRAAHPALFGRKRRGDRMQVRICGDEYTGTPEEIVEAMREAAWDKGNTAGEFMQQVARNVWRVAGWRLEINGGTEEERCESFLLQLAALNIAEIEEAAS